MSKETIYIICVYRWNAMGPLKDPTMFLDQKIAREFILN